MNVKDKSIMITGAGGGLGSVMASLLAENGAQVMILDMDSEKGQAAADAICEKRNKVWFFKMDVTSEEDWKNAVDYTIEKTGRVDVVVNNAGINIRKPVEEMTIDEWVTMMKVNTGSVFLGCKYAIPVMRKQGGGCFINTSSVCGLIGHKYTPEAYTASKGAVTMLTKAIASRYAGDGIRSNSIHPSTVYTVNRGLRRPDNFVHEQSLVIETEQGLVIFNSCSHTGMANILADIKQMLGRCDVCAYVGGLHLFKMTDEELEEVCMDIRNTSIEHIFTGRCTGDHAFAFLQERLGRRIDQFSSGYQYRFFE